MPITTKKDRINLQDIRLVTKVMPQDISALTHIMPEDKRN